MTIDALHEAIDNLEQRGIGLTSGQQKELLFNFRNLIKGKDELQADLAAKDRRIAELRTALREVIANLGGFTDLEVSDAFLTAGAPAEAAAVVKANNERIANLEAEVAAAEERLRAATFTHMDRLKVHEIVNYDQGKALEAAQQKVVELVGLLHLYWGGSVRSRVRHRRKTDRGCAEDRRWPPMALGAWGMRSAVEGKR